MKTATASFAAAAALVAMAAVTTTAPAQAKTHSAKLVACYGVNSCKGQSDCKTAHNDCMGMNSCKGMGFKDESAKACKAAGGSLTPPA